MLMIYTFSYCLEKKKGKFKETRCSFNTEDYDQDEIEFLLKHMYLKYTMLIDDIKNMDVEKEKVKDENGNPLKIEYDYNVGFSEVNRGKYFVKLTKQ
jgi:hypothetical protein